MSMVARTGQVEGGEFSHLVRSGIVGATVQHADMAHRALLGQILASMLPQLRVPGRNFTQRLFALTYVLAKCANKASLRTSCWKAAREVDERIIQ